MPRGLFSKITGLLDLELDLGGCGWDRASEAREGWNKGRRVSGVATGEALPVEGRAEWTGLE